MLILFLFIQISLCALGVDLSTATSKNSFHCFKTNGRDTATVRIYQSIGKPDPNAVDTLRNCHAAGMTCEGYIFPCPTCGDPEGQVKEAIDHLRSHNVEVARIFLDIEGSLYWMKSLDANRKFFEGLCHQLESMGVKWGVYSSRSQWVPIFGSDYGTHPGTAKPLWYADYGTGTAPKNFDDYEEVPGWPKPSRKQYQGTTHFCDAGVDFDWWP